MQPRSSKLLVFTGFLAAALSVVAALIVTPVGAVITGLMTGIMMGLFSLSPLVSVALVCIMAIGLLCVIFLHEYRRGVHANENDA